MCERLAENVGKGSFNVYNYVNLAALDNICGLYSFLILISYFKGDSM